MSIVFAQVYLFSLILNSLQQKFSLASNYLGTNSVAVKRVDCISIVSEHGSEKRVLKAFQQLLHKRHLKNT